MPCHFVVYEVQSVFTNDKTAQLFLCHFASPFSQGFDDEGGLLLQTASFLTICGGFFSSISIVSSNYCAASFTPGSFVMSLSC